MPWYGCVTGPESVKLDMELVRVDAAGAPAGRLKDAPVPGVYCNPALFVGCPFCCADGVLEPFAIGDVGGLT